MKSLEKLAMQRYQKIMKARDKFLTAFIAETGAHPSKVEMVIRRCINGDDAISYQLKKKNLKKGVN